MREAFSLAIDRDALNQVVFEGLYTPANQAFSPVSPYHVKLPSVPPATWKKPKHCWPRPGVKTPLNVELLVANNPTSQQVGQVIQAMVGEAGFNVNLQMTEFATLLDRQQQRRLSARHVRLVGSSGSGRQHLPFINSKGGLNDGRYSNPQVDELADQGPPD